MCTLKFAATTLASLLLATPTFAGSQMPMEDSWDRTLGFVMHIDEWHVTHAEVQQNSPHYFYSFITPVQFASDFRLTNPWSNLAYYLFWNLDNPTGRPDPVLPEEDTPETRLRTLLWWMYEADGVGHPDWILYQCDGVTPAYASLDPPATLPNMPLDFTNPDVVDWQVQQGEALPPAFTAFSADLFCLLNMNAACGVYRNGQWVQLFSGEGYDPIFEAAAIHWASELRRLLAAQPNPKGLVINFPPDPGFDDEEIAAIAANVDGFLDEEGFTYFDLGRDQVDWLVKIRRMIEIQNQGLAFYSVNYVDNFPPTPDEMNWILGSFMMGREHSAYVVITGDVLGGHDAPPWPHLPQFDEDVGHPCAPMHAAQGVYVRDFSKGMALVNPSHAASYTFTLPAGNFTDLYGAPVRDGVDLAPLTGKVLLSFEQRCP